MQFMFFYKDLIKTIIDCNKSFQCQFHINPFGAQNASGEYSEKRTYICCIWLHLNATDKICHITCTISTFINCLTDEHSTAAGGAAGPVVLIP